MHQNVRMAGYYRRRLGAVNLRISISAFRRWIRVSSLIVFVTVLTLHPAVGRTDVVLAPSTESSAGGATDSWLVKRGLVGQAMISEQSGSDTMTPPLGVEVDETRQTENLTGEVLNRVKSWNEMVADDTIHIEVATLSTYQFEVAFWLFPNHRKGCTMYKWTLYDHGRALQSAFWRNDATVLRLAGAADLPHDLYPDSVPWAAFLRVLDVPRDGAEGMLDQQITPYSYVGQEVLAKGSEQINVAAGSFPALKVTAQVDVATILPNWPRFVLHVNQTGCSQEHALLPRRRRPIGCSRRRAPPLSAALRLPRNSFASISRAVSQT